MTTEFQCHQEDIHVYDKRLIHALDLKNHIFSAWTNGTIRNCTCPCKAAPGWYNLTQGKVAAWLQRYAEQVRSDLALDKRELNSFRRQRTSVSDPRRSATGIGAVGVVIICGVIGAIVSCDSPRLWKHAMLLKRRCTCMFKPRKQFF